MDYSPIRTTFGISVVILAIAGVISAGKIWENVTADEYVVIQSPIAGDLSWRLTPGVAWQGFGDVTAYKIRTMYDFREKGYAVQFNDGGHGTIFGSIQCDLSPDLAVLTPMHRKYPTQQAVETGLIKTATEGAIYLVGTLMSSRESYAEKKNDLIHYVTDQVQFGPYRTRQKREWIKDVITSQDKEVVTAEIVLGKDGLPERQERSTLSQYKIHCYQFTINRMAYDAAIELQIKQQQAITMNVQTSIADKVLAEQRAQTAEASGRANATEAKWTQETIKAKETTKADQERQVAVIAADKEKQVQLTNATRDKEVAETQANQRLAVADLDRRSAEQKKLELTLLGEGQANQRRAIIEADGALQQRLDAYKEVNFRYADTLRGAKLVPDVVLSGGASGNQSSAQDLLDLLKIKTARNLSVDMNFSGIRQVPRAAMPASR
ncbi:MAG: hypothetical protein Q7N50_10760 [Armatimonadota bacterium]|nr:hypothetical protein [Armatimonadota bacterium]